MNLFRTSELCDFLQTLQSKGPVIPLNAWDQVSEVTLLRHDIDLDVRPAYEMFKLERDLGVSASYYFLTTCHTYNPGSAANRAMIREMAEADFEIGLHFDPLIYPDADPARLREAVRAEADLLARISGRPVTSLSLHNPSVHGQYPVFSELINAYQSPYFQAEQYLSDSRMGFRGKDPYRFVAENAGRTIQILLHPLHFSQDGDGYDRIMRSYLQHHLDQLDGQFRPVNEVYANQVILENILP